MRSAAAPRPLPSLRTASGVTSGLKPKNEWIVWPRTLSAATPVGDALERLAAPELEQGRFPGPGLAGDEDVVGRPLHDVEGVAEPGIDLDRRGRRHGRHAGPFCHLGILSETTRGC